MKRKSGFDDDRPARRTKASEPEDEEDRYSWLEFDKNDEEEEEEGDDEDLEEEEVDDDFLDDEDAFDEEPEDSGIDFGRMRDDDDE